MKTFRIGVLAACVSLMSTAALAQKVNVDYDKEVDFSKFRSYKWERGQSAPSPLVDKRIVSAIDAQFAAKGWTKSEEAPSVIVVYYAAIDAEKQLNAWGTGPRWRGIGTVTVDTIYTGQLVVDVYDAAARQLIWRGTVSDTVSDKPERNEKRLNDAVAKLFKQFPPMRSANLPTYQF
jgi:uncharacterized protein DUF4136